MDSVYLTCSKKLTGGQLSLPHILHSSNEPGELSQWLCHDDSTINIVVIIIIIIISSQSRIFQFHSAAYFLSTQSTSSPRDQLPITRLRAASKFPRIPARTKKYQSFFLYALADLTISSSHHYDCIVLIIVLYYCVLLALLLCLVFFNLMGTILVFQLFWAL